MRASHVYDVRVNKGVGQGGVGATVWKLALLEKYRLTDKMICPYINRLFGIFHVKLMYLG